MTVKDLYSMCDNLNQLTLFEIRTGYPDRPIEIDATYVELDKYWETRVKGFMVGGRTCTIYI